jgi:hypothetical protein
VSPAWVLQGLYGRSGLAPIPTATSNISQLYVVNYALSVTSARTIRSTSHRTGLATKTQIVAIRFRRSAPPYAGGSAIIVMPKPIANTIITSIRSSNAFSIVSRCGQNAVAGDVGLYWERETRHHDDNDYNRNQNRV